MMKPPLLRSSLAESAVPARVLPAQAPAPTCGSPTDLTCQRPTSDPLPDIRPETPPLISGHGGGSSFFDRLIPDWSTGDGGLAHLAVAGTVSVLLVWALIQAFTTIAEQLGWMPVRMRNFALASLALILGSSSMLSGWDLRAPLDQYGSGATTLFSGDPLGGIASMTVLLLPLAWVLATLAYTNRLTIAWTTGFRNVGKTERFKRRFVDNQHRSAARMARYPVPLSTGGLHPQPVFGRLASVESDAPPASRAQALMGRHRSLFVVPWQAMREHMITVANTGSGKTTLQLRGMVSWYVTAWLRHRQWWRHPRTGRPLIVFANCKGGPQAIKLAERIVKWFRALGVRRIGIVNVDTKLSLWNSAPTDIAAVLVAMLTGGVVPKDDTERYFRGMLKALIRLIVTAPKEVIDGKPSKEKNPPRSSQEFLARFDPYVLAALWGGYWDPDAMWTGVPGVDLQIQSALDGEQPVMNSALSEYSNLFDALDGAFDGTASIQDFDLLILNLEGTSQPERATAQFNALGCLFEQMAGAEHGRETLAVFEEYSAVSDQKNRADKWVQRFREAMIGTWWIAHDWISLGATEEMREALVAATGGGGMLGRQENGGRLAGMWGTAVRFVSTRSRGPHNASDGTLHTQKENLVDTNRLRSLPKGAFAHVGNGVAHYGHIAQLDDDRMPRHKLHGIDKFVRRRVPSSAPLAPVIDLNKHREAR